MIVFGPREATCGVDLPAVVWLWMKDVDTLLREFAGLTTSANATCRELLKILRDFGFQIIDCGRGGHKIAKHPAISIAESPNFNCGHDLGTKVKRVYLKKLFHFVDLHKEAIRGCLNHDV